VERIKDNKIKFYSADKLVKLYSETFALPENDLTRRPNLEVIFSRLNQRKLRDVHRAATTLYRELKKSNKNCAIIEKRINLTSLELIKSKERLIIEKKYRETLQLEYSLLQRRVLD
jgi:hypothetical protein